MESASAPLPPGEADSPKRTSGKGGVTVTQAPACLREWRHARSQQRGGARFSAGHAENVNDRVVSYPRGT